MGVQNGFLMGRRSTHGVILSREETWAQSLRPLEVVRSGVNGGKYDLVRGAWRLEIRRERLLLRLLRLYIYATEGRAGRAGRAGWRSTKETGGVR